jgi:serine/threonine protein kinase
LKSLHVVVPADSVGEAILIDFSHACHEGSSLPCAADQKENPVGTAKYLAPEKWEGDVTHGFEGDVFAFGVMAYYACTGRHPFEGDPAHIQKQIREATPPSPIELGMNLPRSTTVTIMSCLEKKPNRRPAMERVALSFGDAANLFR